MRGRRAVLDRPLSEESASTRPTEVSAPRRKLVLKQADCQDNAADRRRTVLQFPLNPLQHFC